MRKRGLLILLILLKFILQFQAIHPVYELHRDEFLHLDLGRHLAWGYQTVPPVTGFISFLIHELGSSVFWVKFFPALFGAMIIWVCWKIVEELSGSYFAAVLTSLGLIFSALLRINTLYQPNSLDFLCWTLLFYTALKYIKYKERRWLHYAALVFAVGFLNKYNIVFLLIGLIPALAFTPQRKIFRDKNLYYAAGLALILILPNLIWQVLNDFPVLWHMRTLSQTQLVNVSRAAFWMEQPLFFAGTALIILLGFVSFFSFPAFRPYRAFLIAYIITMAIFTFFRAKSYYAMGIYPVFLAFGAVYLEHLLSGPRVRLARIPVLLLPVISFLPVYDLTLPVLSPEQIMERKDRFDRLNLTRWEDGEIHDIPQDYADMLGWSELAQLVDSAYSLVDEKDQTLVHCDNYGEAGAVNFYGDPFYEALSLNADYIKWYPLDAFEIKHVILVSDPSDDDPERTREQKFFDEVVFIGEITHPYAREKGCRVHLLKNARISINDVLREEINTRTLR